MSADLVFLVGGLVLLAAVTLPGLLSRTWLSPSALLILVGCAIGLLPLPNGLVLDPVDHRDAIEHITEITVLLALMGVGLALDRPLSPLRPSGWPSWSATWKLLGIAMPLCIGAIFLLGWLGMGLSAASALLLAAALAPTDPVLASDVQVGGPTVDTDHEDDIQERDEVRFALTSEAGLNDGLAFPFVYAAIFLATRGPVQDWGLEWLAWDLVGRVLVGVLVGTLLGRILAGLAFRSRAHALRWAEHGEPLLALAAMFLVYGAAEMVHGYGFLAVFAAAMSIRSASRTHEFHEEMHGVIDRLERLMTLVVLLMVGISLTDGALEHLDLSGVAVALTLVLVVRPLAGWIALSVGRWQLHDERHRPLERREKAVTAFFGIRGVGTLYYLAYALGEATFPEERWLWATGLFTIVLSVVVHGISSTPVIESLERGRERLTARRERRRAARAAGVTARPAGP